MNTIYSVIFTWQKIDNYSTYIIRIKKESTMVPSGHQFTIYIQSSYPMI